MLVNFLTHLFALDIGWIIGLIMGNLFWVFAFLAVSFYFSPKKCLLFFVIWMAVLYADLDFITVSGWALLAAPILLLGYLRTMSVVGLVENSPLPPNYVIIVNEITYWLLVGGYTLFVLSGGF